MTWAFAALVDRMLSSIPDRHASLRYELMSLAEQIDCTHTDVEHWWTNRATPLGLSVSQTYEAFTGRDAQMRWLFRALFRRIDQMEAYIMAAADDLKAAVAALQQKVGDVGTAVTAETQALTQALADLAAAKGADGSVSATDAEAAVAAIQGSIDNLSNIASAATAAATPTPPTPPATPTA